LITLGVYHRWAKTGARRYPFSESRFGGPLRVPWHRQEPAGLPAGLRGVPAADHHPVIGAIADVDLKRGGIPRSVLFLIFIPVAMVGRATG
jgi:hypothetical protein